MALTIFNGGISSKDGSEARSCSTSALQEYFLGFNVLNIQMTCFVGAPTLVELRLAALNVFSRFSNYGIKVNFEKVKWVCTKITFLGYEIKNGPWNQANFDTGAPAAAPQGPTRWARTK